MGSCILLIGSVTSGEEGRSDVSIVHHSFREITRCISGLIRPDVNAPITALEDAVIACIRANTPLFFGCDVGKSSSTPLGIMDTDLFDLQSAYGFTYSLNKADRLRMGETQMTHAMVISAVHLDASGRPLKYKVENSWSDAAGEKGWFMMTSEWFREHVFQVVVPRGLAEKRWVEVLDKGGAVRLDAWDPMGSLA